jgi:copper chaperone CopZ
VALDALVSQTHILIQKEKTMRFASTTMALAVACGISLLFAASAQAETKVTISGTHLCCGACVKAVDKALGNISGVKHEASQGDHAIVLKADSDEAAQKAVDALAAAGFYGKVDSQTVKYKDVAAPQGNVKRLELSGVHNCCGSCNKSIKAAVATVKGVSADTAKAKESSFVVEGDFIAKDLVAAMLAAGFYVQVK